MSFVLALWLFLSPPGPAETFSDVFRAGLLALQKGDVYDAQVKLLQASGMEPRNGRVWVALAQTHRKLNQNAKADEAAERAAELGANDGVVLQALVLFFGESGQTLRAAESQWRYWRLSPADEDARRRAAALFFEAAQTLLGREEFADAIALLQSAEQKVGKDAQLRLALGVALYGLRRFDEAAQAFLGTISLDPSVPQPYVFLGKMLDQIAPRLPEVTERFAAYEKAHPADYQAYLLHARALDAQAISPEVARKLLEKSIELNPREPSAHFELGSLLERVQQYGEAAREFEKAAALEPANAATHYHLSRIYGRLGKTEAAAAERDQHRKLAAAQNASR